MIKRALLSVYDKDGLLSFANRLHELGVELISTGGTAKALREGGLPVTEVAALTGFPECLDGRVKTLDPHIHAGILARRDVAEHMDFLREQGLQTIDLIVVNLYPFKETVLKPGTSEADCVEQIDIGGPTMLRAAAKNHAAVTVVVDTTDYETVLEEIRQHGDTTLHTRRKLAQKVFAHTAAYDSLVADYLSRRLAGDAETSDDERHALAFPSKLTLTYEFAQTLRYGENSHQEAAFYREPIPRRGSVAAAKQLQGKALSYNNISDTAAAMEMLQGFSQPTVVAVKHANPCGIGTAETMEEAWKKAYEGDPVSIFGGIVAVNRQLTVEVAAAMAKIFLEVIVAPAFSEDALRILAAKPNLRLLCQPDVAKDYEPGVKMAKFVYGGVLLQDADQTVYDPAEIQVVTRIQPDAEALRDAYFGMQAVKQAKSNAIVIVKNGQTLGVGPGQTNRIGALKIAADMAGERCQGAVLASDAFFPFDDCVREAARRGISVIVQPGGSKRDADSIQACDELGIAMIMTGVRHFRH